MPRPVGLKALAASASPREVTWREGAKGKPSGRSAWLRAWPGGRTTGECAGADPVWRPIEGRADGQVECALTDPPARTGRIRAARPWEGRWPEGRGYRQRKEEPGPDQHEGRSCRGSHDHTRLVMVTFGFPASGREREGRDPARPGSRGYPAGDHGAGDPPGVAGRAAPICRLSRP